MARIDRKRLNAADFQIILELPIRFDDLDIQGHVNNAAAVVILQEARVNFNRATGLPMITENRRAMVAALNVEYADEIYHPGNIEVSTGVLAVGRTSFTLGQVARQEGKAKLYAQVVMVLADGNGPAPVPDELRPVLERLLLAEA